MERSASVDCSVSQARDAVFEAEEKIADGRREFLKRVGAGAAAAVGVGSKAAFASQGEGPGGLEKGIARPGSPYANFWNFAPGLLYMQVGQTGATPTQAVDDFSKNYHDIASTPQAYTFGQQGWLNAVAPGFGADPTEITFSFSTTDGLMRIAGGLTWQAGDELITSNMEESAGIAVQGLLADRYGVVIRQANVPTNDAYSDTEMFNRLTALLTSKTKAILFSSPMYLTGTRLPEKDICMWAAQNKIISILDGAHLPGMVNIDLHDIGCDFMAGAGHKWQCGPGQTGILYVRNGNTPDPYVRTLPAGDSATPTIDIPMNGYSNTNPLPTFWPIDIQNYVAGGNHALNKGRRSSADNVGRFLQSVGNGSRPSQATLAEVCMLWDNLGRQNIEDFLVSVAQYLRANMVSIWGPKVLSVPYSASTPHVGRTGLTAFNPFAPGFDFNADLTPAMAASNATKAGGTVTQIRSINNIVIVTRNTPHSLRSDPTQNANVTSGANKVSSTSLRISTHLWHSVRDVDRVLNALVGLVPHP